MKRKNDIYAIVNNAISDYGKGVRMSDVEVAALVVYAVSGSKNSVQLAKGLIDEYGTLKNLCETPYYKLVADPVLGKPGAVMIRTIAAALENINSGYSCESKVLDGLDGIIDYLRPYFRHQKVEKLYSLMLSTSYAVLGTELVSMGNSDTLLFDMRLVVEKAINSKAKYVVLAHNHFISCHPSEADVKMTVKISNCLNNIGIELHDHLIFCDGKALSLRGKGFFKKAEACNVVQKIDEHLV